MTTNVKILNEGPDDVRVAVVGADGAVSYDTIIKKGEFTGGMPVYLNYNQTILLTELKGDREPPAPPLGADGFGSAGA